MKFSALLALTCAALATARSVGFARRQAFLKQNGEDAIALNAKYATLTQDAACSDGDTACINSSFAICDHGTYALTPCASGLVCAALPLVLKAGTTVSCTTAADRDARIAATGATGAANATAGAPSASSAAVSASASTSASVTASAIPLPSAGAPSNSTGSATPSPSSSGNGTAPTNGTSPDGGDPQTSLTLSPQVIANFTSDGQSQQPEPGQTASLTSSNNFINFCLTVPNLPLTNGQQLKNGSCNPAPMGVVAGTAHMPSAKFLVPANGAVLPAHTTFTVKLAVARLATGAFVNADTNFLAAPQQVDAAGDIVGHSHVVIEALSGLAQTTPTDPTQFVFFKGLNAPTQGGVLSADVTGGLAPGVYRIASINTAANHQPPLVAVAQHGAMDDMVYFTVEAGTGNVTSSATDGSTSTSASSATFSSLSNTAAPASTTASAIN